jgi:protein TonB
MIEAQPWQGELTSDPLPVPATTASLSEPAPIDPQVIPKTEAPALIPVADPSVVAFALPVEGPVRIVEPKRAAFAAPATAVEAPRAAPAQVQQIVYGQGEGRQPAPEYPYRARREGQEGVVKVRFNVGEQGQVMFAEASAASPWPLLNEAAVKVVRERWRFRVGPARLYEVSIRFQITR